MNSPGASAPGLPSARVGYSPGATPKASCPVGHAKKRLQPGPTFASDTEPCQRVGRGHPRGLDGPWMPKPISKSQSTFSSEC